MTTVGGRAYGGAVDGAGVRTATTNEQRDRWQ